MFSTSPQINHSITSSTPLFSLPFSSSSRKPSSSSPNFIAKMLLSSAHKRSTSSSSNSSTSSSSSSSDESTSPFLPTIHSPKVSLSKKDQRDRDIKRARRSGGVFDAEDLKRSEEMYWQGAAKEMGF